MSEDARPRQSVFFPSNTILQNHHSSFLSRNSSNSSIPSSSFPTSGAQFLFKIQLRDPLSSDTASASTDPKAASSIQHPCVLLPTSVSTSITTSATIAIINWHFSSSSRQEYYSLLGIVSGLLIGSVFNAVRFSFLLLKSSLL